MDRFNDAFDSGFDAAFAALIGQLDIQPGWAQHQGRTLLTELLGRTGGRLSRSQAGSLAELVGRDVRTIYRWRDQILTAAVSGSTTGANRATAAPNGDRADGGACGVGDETVLDRLLIAGPQAFEFDSLMISLAYLCGGNQRMLRRELIQGGYPMPSEATICRRWKELPPLVRKGAKVGLRDRSKSILHVRYSADAPDEVWQFDAFNLDIFVRTPGGTTPVRPTGLVLLDDHSRFIVSSTIVPHAMRTEDVLAAFGSGYEMRPAANGTGVIIGGLPDVVAFDNDQAILAATDTLSLLPSSLRPLPACSPTRKGKVERVGQTVQAEVVTGRPGWVTQSEQFNGRHLLATRAEHLLTFDQIVEMWNAAVYHYNYERGHAALKGRVPFDVYSTNRTPRRVADADLAELMQPVRRRNGLRTVHNDGLHVFSGHYASVDIGRFVGKEVEVRCWPDRHDHLAVFDDGRFVAMVPRADHLTADDRRALLLQQVEDRVAVQHHAKVARAAMVETGRAVEFGGDTSRLAATVRAAAAIAAPPVPAVAGIPAADEGAADGDDAGRDTAPAAPRGAPPGASPAAKLAAERPSAGRRRRPPTAPETRAVPTRRASRPSRSAQAGRDAAAAALEDEDEA